MGFTSINHSSLVTTLFYGLWTCASISTSEPQLRHNNGRNNTGSDAVRMDRVAERKRSCCGRCHTPIMLASGEWILRFLFHHVTWLSLTLQIPVMCLYRIAESAYAECCMTSRVELGSRLVAVVIGLHQSGLENHQIHGHGSRCFQLVFYMILISCTMVDFHKSVVKLNQYE